MTQRGVGSETGRSRRRRAPGLGAGAGRALAAVLATALLAAVLPLVTASTASADEPLRPVNLPDGSVQIPASVEVIVDLLPLGRTDAFDRPLFSCISEAILVVDQQYVRPFPGDSDRGTIFFGSSRLNSTTGEWEPWGTRIGVRRSIEIRHQTSPLGGYEPTVLTRGGSFLLTFGDIAGGYPFGLDRGGVSTLDRTPCSSVSASGEGRADSMRTGLTYWTDGAPPFGPDEPAEVVASFDASRSGTVPGQVSFRSTSTHSEGEFLTHRWDFGDGATSTSTVPVHTYALPGEYTVRLEVEDADGVTSSRSEVVEIPAPPLDASMDLPGGAVVGVGDEFDVEVRLSAPPSVGGVATVGGLTEVAPVGEQALRLPPNLEVVESPVVPEGGFTLENGRGPTVLTWKVRAVGSGNFTARSTWAGRDAAGRATAERELEAAGSVSGLRVSVEQRPGSIVLGEDNNGDGVVDAADALVEVVVTVSNDTAEPIDDVTTVVPGDPVQFSAKGQGLEVPLVPVDVPPGLFGTIEKEAQVERVFTYRADDALVAQARVVVVGSAGGRQVTASGAGDITVGRDLLVEARFAVEQRPYLAGQPVRVIGDITNVSQIEGRDGEVIQEGVDVGVIVFPEVEGNAAGGYLFDAANPGPTPQGVQAFRLGPGESVDVGAVVSTARVEVPSTAEVTYQVAVWTFDEDAEPSRAEPTRVKVVEESPWSASHVVGLSPVVQQTDPWTNCEQPLWLLAYLSCEFLLGTQVFLGNLAEMGLLVREGLGVIARAPSQLLWWTAWMARQSVLTLLGDPAARSALENELLVSLTAADLLFWEAVGAAGSLPTAIADALTGALNDLDELLRTGDLRTIAGVFSRKAGENLDMTLEALVAARTLKKVLTGTSGVDNAVSAALRDDTAAKRSGLAAKVDDVMNTGGDVTRAGVLPFGADVTALPRLWRDAYGARAEDIAALLKLAADEGVIIAFRSRAPRAAELIDNGLAWLKPSGVTIKTVNDIDRKFLGYPDRFEAKAVLVEPPIAWKPKGPERDALVNAHLDRFGQLTGSNDFSRSQRAAVRERLEARLDEWPKQLEKFSDYSRNGIDVTFRGDKNGLAKGLVPENELRRRAQVVIEEIPAGAPGERPRKAFRLQMEGPNGGPFRDITGDIDLLGIFGLDGKVLTDVAKRTRIYQELRKTIGMQHGESFTFSASAELREAFLSCCGLDGEAMLAAMPDLKLRVTAFADNLSTLPGGPNAGLATGDDRFAFLAGILSESNSAVRPVGSFSIPDPFALFDRVGLRPGDAVVAYSPARLDELVEGLEADVVGDRFDRSGQTLRPDGSGGMDVYEPPSTSPTGGAGIGGAGAGMLLGRSAVPVQMTTRSLVTAASAMVQLPGPSGGNDEPAPADVVAAEIAALLAELAAAGWDPTPAPGALGGRWVPIDVADALAAGDPDVLGVAPLTYVAADLDAGSDAADVLVPAELGMAPDTAFFAPGDTVVLDPSGPGEELVRVAASATPDGALRLVAPVVNDHPFGTLVVLVDAAAETDPAPDDPVSDDPTTGDPAPPGPGPQPPGSGLEPPEPGDPAVPGGESGNPDAGSAPADESVEVLADAVAASPRNGSVQAGAASPSASLALTGGDPLGVLHLAVLLLLAGLLLVGVSRVRVRRFPD